MKQKEQKDKNKINEDIKIAHENFYKARLYALDRNRGWPYLARGIYALSRCITWTTEIPFAAVDKYWRLYLNPVTIKDLPVSNFAAILVHEVWHCILEHFNLADNFLKIGQDDVEKRHIFNIAADLAINQIDNLFKNLPGVCQLTPESIGNELKTDIPKNLNTLEYYKLLLDILPKTKKQISVKIVHGSGEGGGKQKWELPDPVKSSGEKEDEPNQKNKGQTGADNFVSEIEARQIVKQIFEDIKNQEIKNIGKFPAWIEELINITLNPVIDWRTELRNKIINLKGQSFFNKRKLTYKKISRRNHLSSDIVRPGKLGYKVKILCVLDTSMSMSQEDLARSISEIVKILESVNCDLKFVQGDTTITRILNLNNANKYQVRKIIGRGGTNIETITKELIDKDNEKYDITVIFTDGQTPWPELMPSKFGRVVTCIINYTEGLNLPSWVEKDSNKLIKINK